MNQTLIDAARQALPGIAWEQVSSNGVEYVYGKGSKDSYGAFDLADIAKFTAELTAERDALDDDLGETPRAVLTDELTALRERMRWVPVSERLPPDYADVLVSQFDAVAKTSHVMAAYCVQHDDQNCVWFARGRTMVTPTHWQPMPAAPEVPQ